ncbi:MAG: hypothetical protein IPM57_00265 [Oligoflexia bacterium]|nr:hypothetical protein [Oligoflexia bacterium]
MKNKVLIFATLLTLTTGTVAAGIDHEAKEAYRDRIEAKKKQQQEEQASEESMRKALKLDEELFKSEVNANMALLTGGRSDANQECIAFQDKDLTLFCQYILIRNYKVKAEDIRTLRQETAPNFVSYTSQLLKLLNK